MTTSQMFLDITFSDCEFASPFSFFITVALNGRSEKRSTDVSEPSTRPVFKRGSLLLPTDEQFASETLTVSVYVSVPDPTNPASAPSNRLLGVAQVPLSNITLEEGASASQRVSQAVAFTRAKGAGTESDIAQQSAELLSVGRATLTLQVKRLTESEREEVVTADTPMPPSVPSLDKELWVVKPFRHRLRLLVHRAEGLPVPAERSVARVVLRLLRPNGDVICESCSSNVPVLPGHHSEAGLAEAVFSQEVLLLLEGAVEDARIQLVLETVSSARAPTTTSVLELHWFTEALALMRPVHLYIRPSSSGAAGGASGVGRARLLVSLMKEPRHEELPNMGAGNAIEIRVSGIASSRPLPTTLQSALLAVYPEKATESMNVPLEVYYYDQRTDLSAFLETCMREFTKGSKHSCCITPMARPSRTPTWGDFVARLWVPTAMLSSMVVHLYDMGSKESVDADKPFGGALIGFATLDVSRLPQSATAHSPVTRPFLMDVRLLEAPSVSVTLEVECRLWADITNPPPLPPTDPTLSSAAIGHALPGEGATFTGLEREAHEFRLNHELSVQLAKEFNMRAAALKRAGEEIVALRRHMQVLQTENDRLKSQVAAEEEMAEQIQRPSAVDLESLQSLSSAELCQKLQHALEKYRAEKSKGVELSRRFEEACRELQRLNGLNGALEDLESSHMEQNKELQRLQDECRRIETYRHLTKTQEKVIAKLEKSLEASLQEVHKAQRVQADIETLKTENLRLREKCSRILAGHRRDAAPTGDVEELKRQLAHKDDEITRLELLVRDVRARQQGQGTSVELQQEKQRAQELEHSQAELEQQCATAESRVQALQRQLEESARQYGSQIMELKVEIARKDARARELEVMLSDAQG